MRIMVDTNVLVSAMFFSSEKIDRLFKVIFSHHNLVISSYTVNELIDVAKRKFPNKVSVIDKVLERMPYEFVYTPIEIKTGLFEIRDVDDYPVLYTAITEGVDVLVTGDKDFFDVKVEKPEILNPSGFLEKYGQNQI
jgi:putative PIN family toxin of toxin-antitoxin system